jgi:DNA-binding response OmpR family regulator
LRRRSSGALDGIIKLNRMSVDIAGRRLRIDEVEIDLTAREWLILECLVRRTGQIVSKERVQQALASPEHDLSANAVEVHVSRLRAKLGNAALIRSLRGLGYRLEEAKSA